MILLSASLGLLGVLVGALTTARLEDRRARDAIVRAASGDFLREVVQVRQSYVLVTRNNGGADELDRMLQSEQRARYEMDKLRLLVRSTKTQYYARRVLRHSHGPQLIASAAARGQEPPLRVDEQCCHPGMLVEHFTWLFADGVRREARTHGRALRDPDAWRLEQRDPGEASVVHARDTNSEAARHCPIHAPERELALYRELELSRR